MIGKFFGIFRGLFRYHKFKILFFIFSTLLCLVVLFPYPDLSDLASSKVAQATRNQVNLQFDDLGFGFLPQLGLKMTDVSLDLSLGQTQLPNLKVDSFGVAPSIFRILLGGLSGKVSPQKAAAFVKKVQAEGLFKGDLTTYLSGSQKLGAIDNALGVNIDVEKIDLGSLTNYLKQAGKSPVIVKGGADLKADMTVDVAMKEQPKGDFNLSMNKFNLPANSYNLGGFTVPLPGVFFKQVNMIGQLEDRDLKISKGQLGSSKDPINGTIQGKMTLGFVRGQAQPGPYDFVVDLELKKEFLDELGTFAPIIIDFIGKKYESKTNSGSRLKFRVKGTRFGPPPKFVDP